MFEELEIYLSKITTPENLAVAADAVNTLSDAGLNSYEQDIIGLMSNSEEETQTILVGIFNILDDHLDRAISEFGVTMNDEAPTRVLTAVLAGLNTIENYGDPQAILTVLSKDTLAVDKFCEVIGVVNYLSWYEIINYVDAVSDALLDNISKLVEQAVEDEITPEDISSKRDAFRKFAFGKPLTLAEKLIQSGARFNTELDYLLSGVEGELEALESDPEKLVNELTGLVLISNVVDTDVKKTVEELLEDYAKDINVLTKAIGYTKDI